MNNGNLKKKLIDLMDKIKRFQETEQKIVRILAGDKYDAFRKSLLVLQDAIDSLQLYVEYVFYDLEATRKENIILQKKLEEISE